MRSVVVTGASSGIGRACVERLARAGMVVFAGVRRDSDVEALRGTARPGRVEPVLLDVTEPTAIAAAAERVRVEVGEDGLDGLVNNAGMALPGPVEALPLEMLRTELEVNVVGQVAVTQAFLPLLRSAKGRIVNIGSVSGRIAVPFVGAYAASKHALRALNDSLRVELRPWCIRVCLVEPAPVRTPIWERSAVVAQAVAEAATPEQRVLYASALERAPNIARTMGERGVSADRVAAVVFGALTTRRPRNRYLVGRHWLTMALIEAMPSWLRDAVLERLV